MSFSDDLLSWYRQNARVLPWRKKKASPYEVLLSETMLQQTQVAKVVDYYKRFLASYPNIESLSKAQEEDVLKLWEGLGYYSRAKNLLKTAKAVVSLGYFPSEKKKLLSLPGIGDYTANALLAIAFHEKSIAMDGNLVRVYTRLSRDAETEDKKLKEKGRLFFLERIAESDPSDFNQALMDLGELVCLPHGKPLCENCPFSSCCEGKKKGDAESFPRKERKTTKKEVDMTVFLLSYQGAYLIRKREEKGLLASLYEFPNVEKALSKKEVAEFLEEKNLAVDSLVLLGKGKHVFSHRIWKMTYYAGKLSSPPENQEFLLRTKAEIESSYPIPSAFDFAKKRLV